MAIAGAAAQWHHGLAEGHLGDLLSFVMVFFAIWWAWMNYTWFASSYDCDDVALSVADVRHHDRFADARRRHPDLFATGQSGLVVGGYAVMRFAMVAMWLRAAASHPQGRATALAYAVGIAVVQVLWIARLLLQGHAVLIGSFFALVVLELLVPILAERRGITPFHPHHIAERYALLTLIVLGEVILASVQAIQAALGQGADPGLLPLVVGGCSSSSRCGGSTSSEITPASSRAASASTFLAGYGHYLVFASVAATGAALAAAVDLVQGEGHASVRVVGLALAGAVAVYLWCLTAMHALAGAPTSETRVGVAVGVAVLLVAAVVPAIGITVLMIGVLLAAAVAHHVWTTRDAD